MSQTNKPNTTVVTTTWILKWQDQIIRFVVVERNSGNQAPVVRSFTSIYRCAKKEDESDQKNKE
ncbi:MAG TPA: hypothetical protein PLD25_29800 [Chloroflexota bacterium]|nr:hypothetical protein [Chloroflexota bacterium]HUM67325.1 hypothetical protein [Chloroflexota bacterium]